MATPGNPFFELGIAVYLTAIATSRYGETIDLKRGRMIDLIISLWLDR